MPKADKKQDFSSLRLLAKESASRAYSPYSKALVGSCVQGKSGHLYAGHNVENSSYGATMCAERVAIFKAISEGEKSIQLVYVYTKDGWPPCGLCLQVISEFAAKDCQIIIGNEKGSETKYQLKDLLPQAFTPDYLKKK